MNSLTVLSEDMINAIRIPAAHAHAGVRDQEMRPSEQVCSRAGLAFLMSSCVFGPRNPMPNSTTINRRLAAETPTSTPPKLSQLGTWPAKANSILRGRTTPFHPTMPCSILTESEREDA